MGSGDGSIIHFEKGRCKKRALEKTHSGDPGDVTVVIFTSLVDAEHFNFAN